MAFNKGTYVLATEDGRGSLVQGYGSVAYKAGEELVVTSRGDQVTVNVRRSGGGRVFHISRQKLEAVTRMIGEVPEGGIEPDDPRIAWLFEDAARLADRLNLCRDFDRMADALGFPGRVRTFTIKVEAQAGLEITAKVEARSRKSAEQVLRERFVTAPPTIKAISA